MFHTLSCYLGTTYCSMLPLITDASHPNIGFSNRCQILVIVRSKPSGFQGSWGQGQILENNNYYRYIEEIRNDRVVGDMCRKRG